MLVAVHVHMHYHLHYKFGPMVLCPTLPLWLSHVVHSKVHHSVWPCSPVCSASLRRFAPVTKTGTAKFYYIWNFFEKVAPSDFVGSLQNVGSYVKRNRDFVATQLHRNLDTMVGWSVIGRSIQT